MQVRAQGAEDAGGIRTLQRIHARAWDEVSDRIAIDDEIERRLAVIVLYAYAEAGAPFEEGAIAQACVDRLMARCAST